MKIVPCGATDRARRSVFPTLFHGWSAPSGRAVFCTRVLERFAGRRTRREALVHLPELLVMHRIINSPVSESGGRTLVPSVEEVPAITPVPPFPLDAPAHLP